MADTKITSLQPPQVGYPVVPATDVLPIVVIADPGMATSGSTRKVTVNQLLGAGGTATLASATITGDLTCSSNVNIGASPVFYGGKIATNGSVAISGGNYLKLWNSTGTGVAGINAGAADTLTFSLTNAFTTAMTLNSTVLAIGVTPAPWATIKALQVGAGASLYGYTATEATLSGNTYYNAGFKYVGNGQASQYQQQIGEHRWFSAANNTSGAGAVIAFGDAKMTLDTSGRLLVGQTSTGLLNINGIDIEGGDSNGGSYIIVNHKLATAAGQQYAFFAYNGVKTGDITQNGTTGVLYNTVSDYRLKESVQPLSNGLSRVSALKPSIYKWKSDGSSGEGFLAHELAEVVPFAVTGEKDALNEDGSVKAQSVDMSRVIPILVAAIQELTAEVNALKKA